LVTKALLALGSRTSRTVRTAGVAEEMSSSTSCGAAPTKAATPRRALSSPVAEPLIAPVIRIRVRVRVS